MREFSHVEIDKDTKSVIYCYLFTTIVAFVVHVINIYCKNLYTEYVVN